MISSVIWSPFEARFGDLLSRMGDHQMFIMDELEIIQAERAKDAERAACIERSRAEHERQKVVADREKADRLESLTAEMKRMMEKEARGKIMAPDNSSWTDVLIFRLVSKTSSRMASASGLCGCLGER
jgi:hypothetical protein